MSQDPVNLNDTKTAFRSLSDQDLKWAYWMFRVIGKPSVVAIGPAMADIALKLRLPIRGILRKTVFAHFCGGETIEESLSRVDQLARYKVGTILDVGKEGGGSEKDFDETVAEVKRTIDEAAKNPWIPFAVFKPTGVTTLDLLAKVEKGTKLTADEEAAYARARKRIESICAYSAEKNVRVMVDAEESWIQNTVDAIVETMMERYNRQRAIVFNTLQMYRHDRLAFLEKSYAAAVKGGYQLGVKLVRGAYMEKEHKHAEAEGRPTPIQSSKDATDRDYDAALRFCVEHLDHIALCAGTHNEASALLLTKLMKEQGIKADDPRISFAQLLGMSDHISFNLAEKGYHVAKYVPYGKVNDLLPYLTRRAQENSSVLGQSSRELTLLRSEMKRRGLAN